MNLEAEENSVKMPKVKAEKKSRQHQEVAKQGTFGLKAQISLRANH